MTDNGVYSGPVTLLSTETEEVVNKDWILATLWPKSTTAEQDEPPDVQLDLTGVGVDLGPQAGVLADPQSKDVSMSKKHAGSPAQTLQPDNADPMDVNNDSPHSSLPRLPVKPIGRCVACIFLQPKSC